MLNKITAQNFARELKIDLFTVYREYLQILLLKYFYTQTGSEKVYFKGGTALRFLYDSFRFSEDLDFTSLLPEKRLKILIDKTLFDLNKEVEDVTFKKTESIADSFSGRVFQSLPEFNFPLTIRLDFSLREKPFFTDNSFIETIFPVGPYPQVSHLKIEEILAEKVRALLTRVRGRDIFDFWFLLSKKVPLNWDLINKKMSLYQRTVHLEKLVQAIEKIPQKEIESDLTKFLPAAQRKLIKEIKDLTMKKLKSL